MAPFEKFTVRAFRLEFDATREFSEFADRVIKNMRAPNVEAFILRRAMMMIILPVVREAYLKGLPKTMAMRVVVGAERHNLANARTKGVERATGTAAEHTLMSIYERMRHAQLRGDGDALAAAQEDYRQQRDAYQQSLQQLPNGAQKNSHYLSSGLFRKRAMQVMDLFVNPAALQTTNDKSHVTVGLGNLSKLENIETPSATEYVLGLNKTRSRNNILWRQLEFGTGVHANKENTGFPNEKLGPGTFNKGLANGMWYYGRSLKKARLVLEGSDGVHAIYGNPQLLEASRNYIEVVGAYLTRLFSGEFLW